MSDITEVHPNVEATNLLRADIAGASAGLDAKVGSDPKAPLDRTYRWIVAVVCLSAAAALALAPVAGLRGPDLPSLTPFFVAGVLATELSTSFLLFVMTRGTSTASLLTLASAYLFGSLMSVFHLLTFPGAVLPGYIILGTDQSARWIYNFWYTGFGILALIAIVLEIGTRRIPARHVDRAIGFAVISVLIAITAIVGMAIFAVDRLPLLVIGISWTKFDVFLISLQVAVLIAGIGLILGVLRSRNLIFLLMSLVLTGMAFSEILSILGGAGRYTLGWIVGRLSWFIAACILFLFFMAQFARKQHLLMRSGERLEERVALRTIELTAAAKQRDLLLRELHHRVKNKMQIVDALLASQARYTRGADASQDLQDVRSRVYVLALAHQHLMQSDFGTFDIAPFLNQLTDNILANRAEKSVELTVEASPLMVTIDFAAPLGLLATELVIDSLDQSIASGGRIALTLQRSTAQAVVLAVSDNRPAKSSQLESESNRAVHRTRIISGLVAQLDGAKTERYRDGLHVTIVFPAQEAST